MKNHSRRRTSSEMSQSPSRTPIDTRGTEKAVDIASSQQANYAPWKDINHARTNARTDRRRVSIRERPAEADDRAIPGHWEAIYSRVAATPHIATLVERHSRYVLLVQVKGKDTDNVVTALVRQVKRLPMALMASLTWDRGTELAGHKRFTIATDVKVYFCDPQSPWQRVSNENTNGLLRQFFPKGSDLSVYSQADLNAIALKLNTRPRKTLGFITPDAKLAEGVAITG
ncbi:IS30 family transposase [Bradyrhizobium sp. 45]|nr:IS30 family transposase [Bradyrhizobium sp. 45]